MDILLSPTPNSIVSPTPPLVRHKKHHLLSGTRDIIVWNDEEYHCLVRFVLATFFVSNLFIHLICLFRHFFDIFDIPTVSTTKPLFWAYTFLRLTDLLYSTMSVGLFVCLLVGLSVGRSVCLSVPLVIPGLLKILTLNFICI